MNTISVRHSFDCLYDTNNNKMSPEQNFDSQKENTLVSGEHIIIPVIEEQITIDKKVIETGKVVLSKVVHEDVDSYTIPYFEEQVLVERIPKNEFVDTLPAAVRYEGDVMIISVLKEVAVVEKKMMLVEELRVTKTKTEKSQTHEVTLRKEEVEVIRTATDTSL